MNSWSGWPASSELSPFIQLRATLEGDPEEKTGYLCDIKVIEDTLRNNASFLVHSYHSEGRKFKADDFLRDLWLKLIRQEINGLPLVKLQLQASPYLSFTINRESPVIVQLTEQFEFSAAHRLHCVGLSEQENKAIFGKCNNPKGHGHNYVVEVTVDCHSESPEMNRVEFQRKVKEVIDRFDHKHLNEDTPEFSTLNPTVENITRVIWEVLVQQLKPVRLSAIRVYETPKTWAEYRGT